MVPFASHYPHSNDKLLIIKKYTSEHEISAKQNPKSVLFFHMQNFLKIPGKYPKSDTKHPYFLNIVKKCEFYSLTKEKFFSS